MFEPEYAEVYGVPFSFLSVSGKGKVTKAKPVLQVRAMPERSSLRIEFPRVVGYRFQMPTDRLEARFDASSILELSARDVATRTELDPIVGASEIHRIDPSDERMQTVVFTVAKRTLDNHFRDEDGGGERPWLFPQLVRITKAWLHEWRDALPQGRRLPAAFALQPIQSCGRRPDPARDLRRHAR